MVNLHDMHSHCGFDLLGFVCECKQMSLTTSTLGPLLCLACSEDVCSEHAISVFVFFRDATNTSSTEMGSSFANRSCPIQSLPNMAVRFFFCSVLKILGVIFMTSNRNVNIWF